METRDLLSFSGSVKTGFTGCFSVGMSARICGGNSASDDVVAGGTLDDRSCDDCEEEEDGDDDCELEL
jgi:hypothetical protein